MPCYFNLYFSDKYVSNILPGWTYLTCLFRSDEQDFHRQRAREWPLVETKWLSQAQRQESPVYEGTQTFCLDVEYTKKENW